MTRVFADTDVVLDLLARRAPFYNDAAALFSLADQKALSIAVSALSFTNLHYILSKGKKAAESRRILAQLKVLVTALPVDDKTIELALHSNFVDFEDAVQYYCAVENGINILLTRNTKDYRTAAISVLTPSDFMRQWQSTK